MSKKILIADDSPTIQKVVELTFMEQDFDVVSVSGGDEAIARLEEVSPQIVVADVHMPGASGIEVCRRVKEISPEVPVLLLVGTFEPFDEAEFESSGAEGVLKKPFDSQELFRRVEDLLEGRPAAPPMEEDEVDEAAPTAEEEEAVSGVVSEEPGDRLVEPELEAEPEVAVFPSVDERVALAGPELEAPGEQELDEAADEAAEEVADEVADEAETEAEAEDLLGPLEEESLLGESAAGADPMAALSYGRLSDEDVDRIARRVAELLSDEVLREIAWEVVPDAAEVVIRERLRELESQVE